MAEENKLGETIEENVRPYSVPSELKITDLRVANINGAPKHCPLIKIYTNQGVVGYGEVRDASSATYALMLKSRLLGENPLNVDKLFRRIKQFGGHSRQGGGVSGVEIALWDIVGKVYGVPVYQLLGGKFRDKVRVYCDTDVDGKHTGHDMGLALKKRMEAEEGACAGKLEIAKVAKKLNLDAIHDTVHEMAKDEARHGAGFQGLYNRYFK